MTDTKGGVSLFLLNRDLQQEMKIAIDARNFGCLALKEASELHHDDLKAINDKTSPMRVKPEELKTVELGPKGIEVTLKPASWNVIRLET